MAKVAIKSEKLSPFGGIFPIMEQFDSKLSSVIDSTLGMRCRLWMSQGQVNDIMTDAQFLGFKNDRRVIPLFYDFPCKFIKIK